MSVRPLVYWPDPALTLATHPIFFGENTKGIDLLAKDLVDSMYHWGGVGLAATQIGIRNSIFVISKDCPEGGEWWWKGPISELEGAWVFCNPVIVEQGKETKKDFEGCLSFPDIFLKVERSDWVKIRAQTVEGSFFYLGVGGFRARAIQHELEHLHQKTMLEGVGRLKKEMVTKKMLKWKRKHETKQR